MKDVDRLSHIGIWIDTKQAKIIHVDEDKYTIDVVLSEIETKEREDGERGNQGRIGDQFLDPEKHRHNKFNEQSKAYLKRVLFALKGDSAFVVFGPSTMKFQLEKEIKGHKDLKGKLDGVKTADSMTENQLAAWVRNFYSN